MRARSHLLCCTIAILGGACGTTGTKKNIPNLDDMTLDAKPDREALIADLETTIRESHRAISGGYEEAFLDGLSRDPRLVMIEIGPQPLIGYAPAACQLRRQFDDHVEFVSKRLEVHVSDDGLIGWSHDELSYRVYHQGRRSIIPLRATGVFERRAGKWLLVQEHLSYGLPDDEALTAAAAGTLARPQSLTEYTSPGPAAKEVRDLVERLIADVDDTRIDHVSLAEDALVIGPDPERVLRGEQVRDGATVRAMFGYASKVTTHDLRVKVSSTGNTAWAAATLALETTREDVAIALGLRATWVLERQDKVWRVVQTHVSLPICRDTLAMRAFGETSPPKDTTAGCGADQVAASSATTGGAGGSARIAGSFK